MDIAQANGSGPGGRIVAADVQQLISSGGGKPAPASAGAPAGHAPQQVGTFVESSSLAIHCGVRRTRSV